MKIIGSKEELVKAVKTIADQSSRMALRVLGATYPISSLTVFSHEESEFNVLTGILANLGTAYNYNNGPRVRLHEPIEAGNNSITYLRIRKPDPERPHIGCNDFDTNYDDFKRTFLDAYPDNLLLIERPGYDMIELRDSDFDVLAYIVSRKL